MKEGMLTLRVSSKNGKDRPKILCTVGKTDELIKDYLEAYTLAERFERDFGPVQIELMEKATTASSHEGVYCLKD